MSSANLTHAETSAREAAVTVHAYRVEVDLRHAPELDRLTFPVSVEIDLTCDTQETWLDFIGEVDLVRVDGIDQRVEHDGARIRLRGLPSWRVTVAVVGRGRYSRTGEGLHRFVDPVDGQTYLYTHCQPAQARRVYPNFDQPDLRAPFTFTLIGPDGWELLSNEPEVTRTPVGEGLVRVDFAPSRPTSTYLTCLAAGPYQRFAETHRGLRLGLLCRRSLARHVDADELLRITRAGLDWFVDNFGTFPWGAKYDQLFAPAANLSGMDHPGLVTLTEDFVFRSPPTAAQLRARANTMVHQISHMWFGDLVTFAWWGDLWLKEAFGEFMGAHVSVEACGFSDGWVDFASTRKAGAYLADSGPTTHPILAEVEDLEAARTNFDAITYAKGASVLSQLIHAVGLEPFLRGCRRFFAAHAYRAGCLADFIEALAAEADPGLGEWVSNWLQTAGHDTLAARALAPNGVVAQFLVQRDHFGPGQSWARRVHHTTAGLYRLADGRLRRQARFPVTVDAPQVEIPAACGLPEPDAVIVNDLDHTFAQVALDARTRETLLRHIGDLEPLTRAVAWNALWAEVRAGVLAPSRFVAAVLNSGEEQLGLLTAQAQRCLICVDRYRAPAKPWVGGTRTRLLAADPGSAAQLVWARAYLRAAPLTGEDVAWVLAGEAPGLELSVDLTWLIWESLAAQGRAGAAELAAPLAVDDTAAGRAAWLRCLASRPDPAVKEEVWARVHLVDAESNDAVAALLAGFNAPGQHELRAPFAERYFAGLTRVWTEQPIEIALRLVRGCFPGGGSAAAHRWLAAHKNAPTALRRLLREAAFEDEIAGLAAATER